MGLPPGGDGETERDGEQTQKATRRTVGGWGATPCEPTKGVAPNGDSFRPSQNSGVLSPLTKQEPGFSYASPFPVRSRAVRFPFSCVPVPVCGARVRPFPCAPVCARSRVRPCAPVPVCARVRPFPCAPVCARSRVRPCAPVPVCARVRPCVFSFFLHLRVRLPVSRRRGARTHTPGRRGARTPPPDGAARLRECPRRAAGKRRKGLPGDPSGGAPPGWRRGDAPETESTSRSDATRRRPCAAPSGGMRHDAPSGEPPKGVAPNGGPSLPTVS